MNKIYLSGPDIFKINAEEIGKKKSEVCNLYGFESYFPYYSYSDLSSDKHVNGKTIQEHNVEEIKSCDILLADFRTFRGPSAAPNVCFECGLAMGLNKIVIGYNVPETQYKKRVIGKLPHDNMTVIDFNTSDDVMLVYSLDLIIFENINKFPSVMKKVSDYISTYNHAK